MCLKVNSCYDKQRAVAIRPENIPDLDWSVYQNMREAVNQRKDLATFRQSRDFRVSQ